MEKFIKPQRVIVSDEDYIKNLIKANLVKDLHDNEEICPYCHGTGMVIIDNPYGLSDDSDKKIGMFPYKHQAISFCQHCYNGIRHRCKLCGEIIQRGYLKHDCPQQKALDEQEYAKKEKEAFDKAPLLPEDKEKDYYYFFSDVYTRNCGYFEDWDEFFDDWDEEHEYLGDVCPEFAWVTEPVKMSMDAHDIVSCATEELYEDAMDDVSTEEIKRLQDFLNEWIKTCGVNTTYYESHKYKVRIPWELYKERKSK